MENELIKNKLIKHQQKEIVVKYDIRIVKFLKRNNIEFRLIDTCTIQC